MTRIDEIKSGRDALIATMELAAAHLETNSGSQVVRDLLLRHVKLLRENPDYLEDKL